MIIQLLVLGAYLPLFRSLSLGYAHSPLAPSLASSLPSSLKQLLAQLLAARERLLLGLSSWGAGLQKLWPVFQEKMASRFPVKPQTHMNKTAQFRMIWSVYHEKCTSRSRYICGHPLCLYKVISFIKTLVIAAKGSRGLAWELFIS